MLHRIGIDRLVRLIGLTFWVVALLLEPFYWRPDLLHPSDFSSDTSNYVAAVERLAGGHDLYALVAGDRPAPLDNPPEWTVPILSPPAIATVNLWQLGLPDTLRFYVSWALGLAAMATLGFIIVASAPPALVLVFVYFALGLATTAWSGNVNALIAPLAAFVWWASRQDRPRWHVLAGALVAIATCVKIGPAFLAIWLVSQRRWTAVASCAAVGVIVTGATALLAGPSIFFDYLDIARATTATPSPLSIPGLASALGLSGIVENLALPVVMLLAVIGMFVWRRSPISFLLAVFAMIFSTPVVREETAALIIVAAVAWIPHASRVTSRVAAGPTTTSRRVVARSAIAGASLTLVAVVASLATGGGDRSSFAITNWTTEPIIVRFSSVAQTASFGFLAPVNEPVYGWFDRAGASPPIATIWTADCVLLNVIRLPRSGAIIEVGDEGAHAADAPPGDPLYADFVPDCAAETAQHVKTT